MPRPKVNVRKRPSGRWQANWRDAHGVRRFKTFDRKRDAEAFLREQWVEADRAAAGLPAAKPTRPGSHAWQELVDLWETKKAHKRSLADDLSRIRNHLTPVLGREVVEAIGPEHITRVEAALHAKRRRKAGPGRSKGAIGAATQKRVLVLLQGMLKMAHREGWIAAVPFIEKPPVPEKPKQFIETREQIRAFLAAAKAQPYPGAHELYALAVTTGLRASELIALDWTDLDLDRGVVTVWRSGRGETTKSGKVRYVPMPAEIGGLMRAWQARCPTPDIVFPSLNDQRQTNASRVFRQIFHRCRVEAGIPRLTFHGLRHTFGSHFVMNGGNINTLQRLMGHASVTTTEQYAHLAQSAFERERERLGGLL